MRAPMLLTQELLCQPQHVLDEESPARLALTVRALLEATQTLPRDAAPRKPLQTLCSWLLAAGAGVGAVPGLRALQEALVATGDKPPAFAGSRDWVGTVEATICLDHLLGVPCKLVHIHEGRGLAAHVGALHAHFRGGGGPVMMGGGTDHGAKGVLGVCSEPPTHYLLVLDPHYWGGPGSLTRAGAQTMGWVGWWELGSFEPDSFYNLCLPQLRLGRAS
ncbi:inactive Ufm1-specific protease 1 [Alligator sinensis]|uniref:Inactive Ufm1-specific protease 1 n=1 Tax=Alligator sinensis TaxID=38654 RepID=A0A3Q0H5F7_ALLSI|nr:inactive Ufm1-specific protease 1 [Alligator sinensis]